MDEQAKDGYKSFVNPHRPAHLVASDLKRDLENNLWESGVPIKLGDQAHAIITAYIEVVIETVEKRIEK